MLTVAVWTVWICGDLCVCLLGFLESLDDFYILSSGLILLQTTNSVYNKTLLKLVVPETLLAWQRVRVANMMAQGGKEWSQLFSMYNSGKWFCTVILRYLRLALQWFIS